jgi:hypothetical protein
VRAGGDGERPSGVEVVIRDVKDAMVFGFF